MYKQFLSGKQKSSTDPSQSQLPSTSKPQTVVVEETIPKEHNLHVENHNIENQDEPDLNVKEALNTEQENVVKEEEVKPKDVDKGLVDKSVKVCWEEVERQCKQWRAVQHTRTDTSAWKTVRLFVSSTFTDFFNEREILVKKVFPELREWCEQRRLFLVECDLRWGVPKDSTTSNTISTCLEEIDRCHAETEGKPFFLNLTGERYGWIPSEEEVTTAVIDQYQWVSDTSITFMEVMHGAYRSQNPNAAFFMRNGEFCSELPQEYKSRFIDDQPLQRKHLQVFKEKVRSRFPKQVFDYSCQFDGITEECGRKRVKLSGLENFADEVLKFFKSAILHTYPDQCNNKELTSDEQEAENQRMFMEKKSEFVAGRDDLVDLMLTYAQGSPTDGIRIHEPENQKAFVRDPGFWQNEPSDNMILCLSGKEGYGKTTVLAKLINEAQQTGMDVFYHFVGCSPESRDTETMYRRLVQYLTAEKLDVESNQNIMKHYIEKLKNAFPSLRDRKTEILLVIDAVNELVDFNALDHLSWLPPLLPGRVRCIISTADNHAPTVHRLREHTCYELVIGPLSQDSAKDIVTTNLAKFNKKLDSNQMDLIINKPCVENPLWVWLLTEELRIFGDFRTLTDKIKTMSDSVESLLSSLLQRMVSEDDTGCMHKALCLISCSKGGIPLKDILNVLGDIEKKEPAPLLCWAKIRRLLKPYLRTVGWREHISFSHTAINKAVRENFMQSKDLIKKWHSYLADYYLYWSQDTVTKVNSIPYHCLQADLQLKLIYFLRKDKASLNIPDFTRSRYLQQYRCKHLADPVMLGTVSAIMCTPCSFQSAAFSSSFHKNKDSCCLCGSWMTGPGSSGAQFCGFHSQGQSKFAGKCVVCCKLMQKNKDGHLDSKFGCEAKLCSRCSFGNFGKMCCFV